MRLWFPENSTRALGTSSRVSDTADGPIVPCPWLCAAFAALVEGAIMLEDVLIPAGISHNISEERISLPWSTR